MTPADKRAIGHLTFQEVGSSLRETSILCLPMGSMEQHGPHLPLNTDAVLAEAFTRRIVERWGEAYDLWQLPGVPVGLSREHAWAPGTLSLSISAMTAWLCDLGREIARSLPARNLLIVNGHGGNRGILEALGHELRGDFGLNIAALHLGAMMSPVLDTAVPEIHAGRDETSAMLALAPELVRRERMPEARGPSGGEAIRALVLDPATSWPWSSDDQRIAALGVMGDAREASVEHGNAIVARVVEATEVILRQLLKNRNSAR
ncbi:MAG: creatininase family protein [Xanthobacteraceae bacterium]|nr:creatininase family protein [Xanthobacteraceae bacterium]